MLGTESRGEFMPYAALENEIEMLSETQRNAVAMFVHFLASRNATVVPISKDLSADTGSIDQSWNAFDRIRAKAAIDHGDHDWTMDEIDAEIAAARKERRERQQAEVTA